MEDLVLQSKPLLNPDAQKEDIEAIPQWIKTYSNFVYEHPGWLIFLVLKIVSGLTILLIFTYGVQPQAMLSNYRWFGDEITQKWDSFVSAARDTYSSTIGLVARTIAMPKQMQMAQIGCALYERPGQNVLDYQVLQEIWRLEEEMRNVSGWGDHCFKIPMNIIPESLKGYVWNLLDSLRDRLSVVERDTFCIGIKSLVTEIKSYYELFNYTHDQIVPEILNQSFVNKFIKEKENHLVALYIGNDYDPETVSSSRLRALVPFALPLSGYRNKYDRTKEQTDLLAKFQKRMTEPLDQFREKAPLGTKAYSAFTYDLAKEIGFTILSQALWIVGTVCAFFVMSLIVQKSLLMSFFGVFGTLLSITSSVCCLTFIFQITYIDAMNTVALFIIFCIGAFTNYLLFRTFQRYRFSYDFENPICLALALRKSFPSILLAYSITGAGFLAFITSGMKIFIWFGIFAILILFFLFFIQYTWYISFISIWARVHINQFDPAILSNTSSIFDLDSQDTNSSTTNSSAFDFIFSFPSFHYQFASVIKNKIEKFSYSKIAPLIYFYRLPIVLIFFAFAITLGNYTFDIPTKCQLKFAPSDSPLQNAYRLAFNGYSTTLNDFSLIYVWGINEKPTSPLSKIFSITEYGKPSYRTINISKPDVQLFLHKAWDIMRNYTDLIDPETTSFFGASPWESWDALFTIDEKFEKILPFIKPFFNISEIPDHFPMTESDYQNYNFIWRTIVYFLEVSEPDKPIFGTLKSNTVGFSQDDNSVKYIAMKGAMKFPSNLSASNIRNLYELANRLQHHIEKEAPDGFDGFHTSFAWLNMVTEEMLPSQIFTTTATAILFCSLVYWLFTSNFLHSLLLCYSLTSAFFINLGTYVILDWQIGIFETLFISSVLAFSVNIIAQPSFTASFEETKQSIYSRIQASLTQNVVATFATTLTFILGSMFLLPCYIKQFGLLAIMFICSTVVGWLHGYFLMPALISLFASTNEHNSDKM